ncbi:hypothetical protein HHI36_007790 [Cryptolaemus montrouzieri]|uniref:G-protein coupled receptors family 2 profile 1 domain-containing protein n=1 Tax=Cryptolaemus montrouzieri TaxID=559131 RepID=A0ABD2MR60_9CUCU
MQNWGNEHKLFPEEFKMDHDFWQPDIENVENIAIQPPMNTEEYLTNNTHFEVFEAFINQTFCENLYLNESFRLSEQYLAGYCGPVADPVTCWPPTPVNTTSVIKCFSELNSIKYDDTRMSNLE